VEEVTEKNKLRFSNVLRASAVVLKPEFLAAQLTEQLLLNGGVERQRHMMTL